MNKTFVHAPIVINKLSFRIGLVCVILGLFILILGAKPEVYGLDISPLVGFIQLTVFAVGLGLISLGGYLSIAVLWNGSPISIAADFGSRLVATGYVITLSVAFADLLGFGTQPPQTEIPCFGPWQVGGVVIGELMIAIGLLLLIPWGGIGTPLSSDEVEPDEKNSSPEINQAEQRTKTPKTR